MSGSLQAPCTQPWENPTRPLPGWGLPSAGEADQGLGAHCPLWEARLRRTLADGGGKGSGQRASGRPAICKPRTPGPWCECRPCGHGPQGACDPRTCIWAEVDEQMVLWGNRISQCSPSIYQENVFLHNQYLRAYQLAELASPLFTSGLALCIERLKNSVICKPCS